MINTMALNSLTNLDEYNCGGFALCIEDWYSPEGYREGQDINDMLEDCADSIQEDFPELTRVSDYSGIPNDNDVIGFRFAIGVEEVEVWDEDKQEYISTGEKREFIEDFHFVLRSDGVWYHKPGNRKVEKVKFNIDHEWPHNHWDYNSPIVWFTRPRLDIDRFFIVEQGED